MMGRLGVGGICGQLGFCEHTKNLGALVKSYGIRPKEDTICNCGKKSPVEFLARVRIFWNQHTLPSGKTALELWGNSSQNLDTIHGITDAFLDSLGNSVEVYWPYNSILSSPRLLQWPTDKGFIKATLSNLIGLQISNTQKYLNTRKSRQTTKQEIDISPVTTLSASESFRGKSLLTTINLKPVEFESEAAIEDALFEWRVQYPAQPLPGTKCDFKTPKSFPSSSTGIYNNCVLKLFRIFAFTDRMMWLLRREDKKFLLLKQMPEIGEVRGYVAWIGGAQGFGSEFAVHPEGKVSGTNYCLRSNKRLQRPVTPSDDPEDSGISVNYPITPDDTPRSSSGRILRSPRDKASLHSPYQKSVNNKTSPRGKMRRVPLVRPNRRGRLSEEPSGIIVVSQNDSEPFKVKEEADDDGHIRSPNDTQPTSSFTSAPPALETTQKVYAKTPLEHQNNTEYIPKKSTFTDDAVPKHQDHLQDITLDFIVPSLEAAMPVAFTTCQAQNDFFTRAKNAWLLGAGAGAGAIQTPPEQKTFKAVTCNVEGSLKRPILIVWDDQDVFHTLSSTFRHANRRAAAAMGVNVEVRCIVS